MVKALQRRLVMLIEAKHPATSPIKFSNHARAPTRSQRLPRIKPALEVAGFFASIRMTNPVSASTLQRITKSFVNFHDKLPVWIDKPAIHSRGIKWQSDDALTID